MASTVLPFVIAVTVFGSRLSASICPSVVAVSDQVISSSATEDTNRIAGAGTAAVTRPAPARKAPSDVIAGAPALPPADPNEPPTTRTWPKFPLFAADARGACANASDEPAHSKFSSDTIASSGEPIDATTTG